MQALLQAMGHFAQNVDKQNSESNIDKGRRSNKASYADDDYSEIIEDKQPGSDAMAGFGGKGAK